MQDSLCAEGHTGLLCNICDESTHYRASGKCYLCENGVEKAQRNFTLVVVAVVVTLIVVGFFRNSIKSFLFGSGHGKRNEGLCGACVARCFTAVFGKDDGSSEYVRGRDRKHEHTEPTLSVHEKACPRRLPPQAARPFSPVPFQRAPEFCPPLPRVNLSSGI